MTRGDRLLRKYLTRKCQSEENDVLLIQSFHFTEQRIERFCYTVILNVDLPNWHEASPNWKGVKAAETRQQTWFLFHLPTFSAMYVYLSASLYIYIMNKFKGDSLRNCIEDNIA
jgi:hypothetical protein